MSKDSKNDLIKMTKKVEELEKRIFNLASTVFPGDLNLREAKDENSACKNCRFFCRNHDKCEEEEPSKCNVLSIEFVDPMYVCDAFQGHCSTDQPFIDSQIAFANSLIELQPMRLEILRYFITPAGLLLIVKDSNNPAHIFSMDASDVQWKMEKMGYSMEEIEGFSKS